MSWWSWRRRGRDEPIPPHAATAPAVPAEVVPADPWRPLAGEFALRLLTLTWEAVHHIGQAEEAELDPQRQAMLFRIDHTITRTRRLAENLRVLTGESVEDPADRQTISLQDITRAAGASAEHYERLSFGPVADLAVAAEAADDAIRILTELIDNADRYSPPDQPVHVAAHLTGEGEVLVRVEDNGIGIPADRMHGLNQLLSRDTDLRDADLQPSRVGLPVVAVLTRRHPGLQVWLSPRSNGGTVAMLRIGVQLLCEVPFGQVTTGSLPPVKPQPALPQPETGQPAFDPERTAIIPVTEVAPPPPLPRRTPGSIRSAGPTLSTPVISSYRTTWHDDAEAFNAGIDAANRDKLTSTRKGTGA